MAVGDGSCMCSDNGHVLPEKAILADREGITQGECLIGMIHVGEQVVHGKTSRSKGSPVNAGFAAPEEGCHSVR